MLLLITAKVFNLYPVAYWEKRLRVQCVLVTGSSANTQGLASPYIDKIVRLKNYDTNERLYEIVALLHHEKKFTVVVSFSETDVERAARIRERFTIQGLKPHTAKLFRDKLLMKDAARIGGLSTPDYTALHAAQDLREFINLHGLPVVVKPIDGRGSAGVSVLRRNCDVRSFLRTSFEKNGASSARMSVETFVDGHMYRIDGLVIDHRIAVCHIGRYLRDCLEFIDGKPITTLEIPATDSAREAIVTFTRHLVEVVLPVPENALFHLQVFERPTGEIVLCEIGLRLGGGAINDEVAASSGRDILALFLKRESGESVAIEPYLEPSETLSGRIIVPAQSGRLDGIPSACPFEAVTLMRRYGKRGQICCAAAMTNAEIMSVVFVAKGYDKLHRTANQILRWVDQEIIWSKVKKGKKCARGR